jgi:hypothetical protein
MRSSSRQTSGSHRPRLLDDTAFDILNGPSSLSLTTTDAHSELIHLLVEENYMPEIAIITQDLEIRKKLLEQATEIRTGLEFLDRIEMVPTSDHLRSPGTYYEYLLKKIRASSKQGRVFYACSENDPVAMAGYDSMGTMMKDGRELMNFGRAATLSSAQGKGLYTCLMSLAWDHFCREFPQQRPPAIIASPQKRLIEKKVEENWIQLDPENIHEFFTPDFAETLAIAIDCRWHFAISDPQLTTPR